MLSVRHPALFPTFADYAGLTSPTVDDTVNPADTIQQLFDGERRRLQRARPATAAQGHHYPT